MTLAELKDSLSKSKPPSGLAPALSALWWAGKNEWKKAHRIVMDESGKDCAWVHAYLHRSEDDLDNARYWYRRAQRPAASFGKRARQCLAPTKIMTRSRGLHARLFDHGNGGGCGNEAHQRLRPLRRLCTDVQAAGEHGEVLNVRW